MSSSPEASAREHPAEPASHAPEPPPAPDPEVSAATKSPRRRLLIAMVAVLIVIAIVGGVVWWLHARHYETTDDAFIDTHMVRISPQVAGRVARVLADDNQAVKPGDLLVEIDPADLQARLDQALANQANAAGSLEQAKAQLTVARANAEQAHADVGVAAANAANAAAQLQRDRPLAVRQVVSQQQLDTSTANARSTAATLTSSQKKEASAKAQISVAASQIDAAAASLKSAAAQVEQARLNLSYTRVTAPAAGHVAQKNVMPGDYVQIGQNLMALVPARVWITANFKETQLEYMRVGQPVEITIDAYPGTIFHGHVDSIQRGSGAAFSLLPPENATGNYVKVVQRVPVKIVFDDPPDLGRPLGPGMSVVPRVKVR